MKHLRAGNGSGVLSRFEREISPDRGRHEVAKPDNDRDAIRQIIEHHKYNQRYIQRYRDKRRKGLLETAVALFIAVGIIVYVFRGTLLG
jgi:hypothetical protein